MKHSTEEKTTLTEANSVLSQVIRNARTEGQGFWQAMADRIVAREQAYGDELVREALAKEDN